MVSVSMLHGHVMVQKTAMMAQMKPIVLKVVPMVNLTVVMAIVSALHGHVTAGMIVEIMQMKLTVLKHV
jgi:hypothetical protein